MNVQLLFLPFFAALALISLSILGRSRDLISIIFSFAPFLILLALLNEGSEFLYHYDLSKIITLSFCFRIDGIAAFFGILITLAAPIVTILVYRQELSERFLSRFHPLFHTLLGGVLIIIFSGDFISFIAGWEIINWSSYFLLMLSKSENRRGLLRYLIATQISTHALLLGSLILYSHTGSFLFSGNESILKTLSEETQILLLLLFSGAFLVRMGALPVLESYSRILQDAPRALSLFLAVALSKIPLYGLFLFSFYFVFDHFDASDKVRQLYQYFLALVGVGTVLFGYYKTLKERGGVGFLPSLSIAEGGYLIVSLSSLSYYSFSGFFLLTLNHTLSLTLLYIVWLCPHHLWYKSHEPTSKGRRNFSLSSFIGVFSLLGIPPFFGFSLKIMLLESLVYENLFIIGALVLLGYAMAWWLLFHQTRIALEQIRAKEFQVSEPQSFVGAIVAGVILTLGIFPIIQQKIMEALFESIGWFGLSWAPFPLFSALTYSMVPYLGATVVLSILSLVWISFLRRKWA